MKKNIVLTLILSLVLFSNNFAMEQHDKSEQKHKPLSQDFNDDLDEQIQIQEEMEELKQLQEEQYKEPKNFFEANPEERQTFIKRCNEKLQKMILEESNSRFLDLINASVKDLQNIKK